MKKHAIIGHHRRWLFKNLVFDERSLDLSLNGDPVHVERKPLEVLRFLLEHAGEVVTKDEILDAVWPGRILTESVLTKCITRLRDAIGDTHQDIIKTQHGYGYRFVASLKVEASTAPPSPRFDLRPGDPVPRRPGWSLTRRLGAGGHGEVWLARHRDADRVFKFAGDAGDLASLKREITLFRLLQETLGDAAPIVPILDWNLEEPPYFIETPYFPAGSLIDWAASNNDLERVPIDLRLDLAAQVAEALAQAHSVGVLHKDLKPANVLLQIDGDPAERSSGHLLRIRVGDFGSGSVLDPERLQELGITRLGFTHSLDASRATSGTPTYFAPEVISGQPFTVQSDIYALGIVLYQLVTGDLCGTLAPGWEAAISDDLLREDIAAACAGDPAKRLTDATILAERLRKLPDRRAARRREQDRARAAQLAQERTQQAERTLERMRARRTGLVVALAALLAGTGLSTFLYVRAEQARQEAEAVNRFMVSDILAKGNPIRGATATESVRTVLDRSSATVDERLASFPAAAARVHLELARAYFFWGDMGRVRHHAQRAADLSAEFHGPRDVATLEARWHLAVVTAFDGRFVEAAIELERVGELLALDLTDQHSFVLKTRALAALYRADAHEDFDAQVASLSQLVATAQRHVIAPDDSGRFHIVSSDPRALVIDLRSYLLQVLMTGGRYLEALPVSAAVLRDAASVFGEQHVYTAHCRSLHGELLAHLGRFGLAEAELTLAYETWLRHSGADNPEANVALLRLAEVQGHSGRIAQATSTLERLLGMCHAEPCEPVRPSTRHRAKLVLAQLAAAHGPAQRAVALARESLDFANQRPVLQGAPRVASLLALTEGLIREGSAPAAWQTLETIPSAFLEGLPPLHPTLGEYKRLRGLLIAADRPEEARALLTQSVEIMSQRYGPDHWRTELARAGLASMPKS